MSAVYDAILPSCVWILQSKKAN